MPHSARSSRLWLTPRWNVDVASAPPKRMTGDPVPAMAIAEDTAAAAADDGVVGGVVNPIGELLADMVLVRPGGVGMAMGRVAVAGHPRHSKQ